MTVVAPSSHRRVLVVMSSSCRRSIVVVLSAHRRRAAELSPSGRRHIVVVPSSRSSYGPVVISYIPLVHVFWTMLRHHNNKVRTFSRRRCRDHQLAEVHLRQPMQLSDLDQEQRLKIKPNQRKMRIGLQLKTGWRGGNLRLWKCDFMPPKTMHNKNRELRSWDQAETSLSPPLRALTPLTSMGPIWSGNNTWEDWHFTLLFLSICWLKDNLIPTWSMRAITNGWSSTTTLSRPLSLSDAKDTQWRRS